MIKSVCVLTATRAEYGLLKPVMEKLKCLDNIELRIIVTGMHLASEYGDTYKSILEDGFQIDEKIPILQNIDTEEGVNTAFGLAVMGFGHYFAKGKPDLLVVLGDRYETLAVCIAAMNEQIPIAHIHGGEITEGAVDEAIRHSISKMSYIHFASTEIYRHRIIQLGEEPNRVFNVGALGVENALSIPLMSKDELSESIGFSLEKQYAIVTFHPITLESKTSQHQFIELLEAISQFDMNYIFTKANADANGKAINQLIDQYVVSHKGTIAYEALGVRRYLSAVKYASMVIGNSSSGLIEVPTFKIPTIDIGNRQKGRIAASSVIHCEANKSDISRSIEKALSEEYRIKLLGVENPYGMGNTSKNIVDVITKFLFEDKINLQKKFFDTSFELDL